MGSTPTTDTLTHDRKGSRELMPAEVIQEIVGSNRLPTEQELRLILRSCTRPAARVELNSLDFKERFEDSPHHWLSLLKHTVAMSNYGGGIVLLGMANDGTPLGLRNSLSRVLDPSNVANKFARYGGNSGPPIAYMELTRYRRLFGFFIVSEAPTTLIFEKDGNYETSPGKTRAEFRRGVVYTRRGAATTEATQAELSGMVSRLLGRELTAFLARIERVATLPADAELVARTPSDGEIGYILGEGGSGTPVTIVPAGTPNAVPVAEVLASGAPFSSLDAELTAQVRQWRQGDPHHTVPRSTLIRWYLGRHLMRITNDAAQFCFLSAAMRHGFPMYWASQMDRPLLRALVTEELRAPRYPVRDVLPYVAGAFFWDDRHELLRPALRALESREGIARRVMEETSRDRFLKRARLSGDSIVWQGARYSAMTVMGDDNLAQTIFEGLLRSDENGGLANQPTGRQFAHQLDIFLHAAK